MDSVVTCQLSNAGTKTVSYNLQSAWAFPIWPLLSMSSTAQQKQDVKTCKVCSMSVLQRLLLPASDGLDTVVKCPPEVLCQVISSIEMGVCAVAHAQLTGEVAVMHMLPQLLPTEEVDIPETTEGMGRCQMGLQLLLIGKQRQLQGERSPCLQRQSDLSDGLLLGKHWGEGKAHKGTATQHRQALPLWVCIS